MVVVTRYFNVNLSIFGLISQNSLIISLLAGNSRGDGFAGDSVLHPRFLRTVQLSFRYVGGYCLTQPCRANAALWEPLLPPTPSKSGNVPKGKSRHDLRFVKTKGLTVR